MNNNITKNLSFIGYSNYYITESGKVYKLKPKEKELKIDKLNRFYMINDNGKENRISLKTIYRQAFNKEYCIDNIEDLPGEVWKPIENTDNKYYISNCGRVKSYCSYYAKILLFFTSQKNNYYQVKIDNKNKKVHRLVAFAFCDNKYQSNKDLQIHHKDNNKHNNNANNLEILTIEEHKKRHYKKGKEKQ